MKKALVLGFAKALGVFAVVFVSTACAWIMHRPEVPAELQRS